MLEAVKEKMELVAENPVVEKKEKKRKADEIGVDWAKLYGSLPEDLNGDQEQELGDEVEPDGETAGV